jgi:hypothetical protein
MKATVDVYVKSGTLRQITLNVAQFAHRAEALPVDLVIKFAPMGPIAAPSGATPIDLDKVAQELQHEISATQGLSSTPAQVGGGLRGR